MASLNKVFLIGNLTRDPEVRYTPKGTAVAEIGLAVNETFTANNERQERTTFIDVTLWGKTAELVGQYLAKGKPVMIEGRLQMESWEDKASGQKRSKLKVTAENVQFLMSGNREEANERPQREQRQQERQRPAPQTGPSYSDDMPEDDIPF